ncbi:MAG: ErfK/YbiS/YcfS/YnhG family protein [Thermoleophilia bacterium]|nr:ErfK/YbiS/YcfS/YnhG family protein [Thermoleophilia bacterium]
MIRIERRRPAAWFVGIVAAAACSVGVNVGSAQAAAPALAPSQETVVVLGPHVVRSSITGPKVGNLLATRPITTTRTVLPVLGRGADANGTEWLRVRLPGRATGGKALPATGWISTTRTRRARTLLHIVVSTKDRRLTVRRAGRVVRSYRAIVGHPSTPTPKGSFFVEENVRLDATHPGAPFALATSARSKVLHEFDGGPGQIAVHGRSNVGGALGTAVSHGCIRLDDAAVTWLARYAAAGTPITIR